MISKSDIQFIKSLHQKKYREQYGMFLVEGVKMVNELLRSTFRVHALYALEPCLNSLQISTKLPENIKTAPVGETELRKISALSTPNKVLAVVHIPQSAGIPRPGSGTGSFRESDPGNDAGEAGEMAPYGHAGPGCGTDLLIALDNVQDPGNMGTIIRIADWFGISAVVASPDSVEFYNPKVVQASMGSLFRVQLRQARLEELLERAGAPVYGALLEGKSIYEEPFSMNGILLLGNESKGLSPGLGRYITHPVTIPRLGTAESLNVAVASAVICSEMRRKQMVAET